MNELTIKERIIKTLLESPKTTGEIAIELGYIDVNHHGKYNIINTDLKTLKQYGFINGKKQKRHTGAPATTYDIVYEISSLRDVVKKYVSIIPDLQKSDKVIGLVWDYFIQRCNEMLPSEEAALLDDNLNVVKNVSEFEIFTELLSPYLRDMLRLSPSYFINILINESFLYSFFELWLILHGYIEEVEKKDNIINIEMFYDIDLLFVEAFSYSVITDFITGCGNPEALKLVRELRVAKSNNGYGNHEALEKLNKYNGEKENITH